MSATKRARACNACHSIKIRCDLGANGEAPPCTRCARLGKECIVTPAKRQKDRVAELEAQVEALTKLLESQKILGPSTEGPQASISPTTTSSAPTRSETRGIANSIDQPAALGKKRRLDLDLQTSTEDDTSTPDRPAIAIDPLVPPQVQRDVFAKYVKVVLPGFPLISITEEENYDTIRKKRPLILQAGIYAASPGILSFDIQEEIAKVVIGLLTTSSIAEGTRSLDLVQALQITVLAYRSPKHHGHVAIFQLIQLAIGISADIGIHGAHNNMSLGLSDANGNMDTADVWRAWLMCRFFCASMDSFTRRPSSKPWNDYDDNCLWMLEYSTHSSSGDRLLCQYVRAERLCQQISSQLNFYDFELAYNVSDPVTKTIMRRLENLITDWKAQVPGSLQLPQLTFYGHAAALHLHETLLHTSTNKQTFTAPYLAERVSVTDFPAPLVTLEHIASAEALILHSHALIELFTHFSVAHLMSQPAMLFGGRAAYATYLLVKLYIAVSAVGNTLGAFISPESLQVEVYLQKVIDVAQKVYEIDERCGSARIISGVSRLKEWTGNYISIQTEMATHITPTPSLTDTNSTLGSSLDWDSTLYEDDWLGFGLDKMFACQPLNEWASQGLME